MKKIGIGLAMSGLILSVFLVFGGKLTTLERNVQISKKGIDKLKEIELSNNGNAGSHNNSENYEVLENETKTRIIYLREGWNPSQKIEIELTPPIGYKKGMTCLSCDGSGTKMYPYSDRESICAACNGRGFDFSKK